MNPDLYKYFMEDNVNRVLLCAHIDKLVSKKIDELEKVREHIEGLEKDWKQIEEELQKEWEYIEGIGDDVELANERKYIEELEKIKKSFEEFKVREETHVLHGELTPDDNTILHVAVQFGHVENVEVVLQACPDLVLQRNKKRETPLHMAAREGQAHIVQALILAAQKKFGDLKVKEMLREENVDGDRALHMAARNCHLKTEYLQVVTLLGKEDPEFQYPPNNAHETPIYLAAERGNLGVAREVTVQLLETCKSLSCYNGPDGRTALHAVALKDQFIGQITIQDLLKKQKDLMNKADNNGWTPLHYAASGGNLDVMEEFLKYSPDCWEKVDNAGQNILHIAVAKNLKPVIEKILKQPWGRHLINQKNKEGNTPLHLLADSDYVVAELWKHPEADRYVFNRNKMTPIDLIWSNILKTSKSNFAKSTEYDFLSELKNEGGRIIASKDHDRIAVLKRKMKEDERIEEESRSKALQEKELARLSEVHKLEEMRKNKELQSYVKIYQSLVIVAALTATITSAAGFVTPGGYDNKGTAVLARGAFFKAFAIANTISLASSVSSIILCLNVLYYYSNNEGEKDFIHERYVVAGSLILVAIVTLMVAFIAAAFAVLTHLIAIGITTCVIGCIGFSLFSHKFKTIVLQLYRRLKFPADTNNGDGMAQELGV